MLFFNCACFTLLFFQLEGPQRACPAGRTRTITSVESIDQEGNGQWPLYPCIHLLLLGFYPLRRISHIHLGFTFNLIKKHSFGERNYLLAKFTKSAVTMSSVAIHSGIPEEMNSGRSSFKAKHNLLTSGMATGWAGADNERALMSLCPLDHPMHQAWEPKHHHTVLQEHCQFQLSWPPCLPASFLRHTFSQRAK